jgi:hypothetical protein
MQFAITAFGHALNFKYLKIFLINHTDKIISINSTNLFGGKFVAVKFHVESRGGFCSEFEKKSKNKNRFDT